jgi:2-C-methyl-D-erythritol 4-phosphate cytidylyltransferase
VGRVWGIVVAGGSGTRFGEAKQFVVLGGRSVAERSVAACRSVCDTVVLVVPTGSSTMATHGADVVVEGGATRAASVRAGLGALGPEAEIVVVHDAARPLATAPLFRAVVDALRPAAVAGSIPGVPVSDTVKRVAPAPTSGGAPRVVETLDRSDLVAVQTPQAFYVDALRRAHVGDPDATDDAALVEALGLGVSVVPGDVDNLKLTTPADLARAELLIGD